MADHFVLDCSMTMTWCFNDEATPFSQRTLRSLETVNAVVPPLWLLEVRNVLLMAERKKRISWAQSSRFLRSLEFLPIRVDEIQNTMTQSNIILQIARDFALTVYDAAYLEVAVRLGAPIATLDKAMKAAAKNIGVKLYD